MDAGALWLESQETQDKCECEFRRKRNFPQKMILKPQFAMPAFMEEIVKMYSKQYLVINSLKKSFTGLNKTFMRAL